MNKAFTKESDDAPDDPAPESPWPLPPGVKNYMTPSGERELREELAQQITALQSPLEPVVKREVERRIRTLERRLAEGEVVDPALQPKHTVRFGARATVRDEEGAEQTYWIVGVDQALPSEGRISWQSAIAKALLGKQVGDIVTVRAPSGARELELIAIDY
jgi:transcription elongation factor GreB